MYPRQFLDGFWSPDIRIEAFVAMSFDEHTRPVYDDAIAPACSDDNGLRPVRVDIEKGGDSIVTRILDGLAHSKLVIAEISTQRKGDPKSRNGNVMWEVGVAHAFRQFDEVLLIRYDDDPLLFDIGQIRVHKYDREDLVQARVDLASLIRDRLAAIELKKSLLVERTLRAIDPNTLSLLLTKVPMNGHAFEIKLPLLQQQMMTKLFELGVVSFAYDAINQANLEEMKKTKCVAPIQKYRVTPFGKALLERVYQLMENGSMLKEYGER